MTQALQRYRARMLRVLDHIDAHLGDTLDLDSLSAVAAFSKYHFHRQFSGLFGISVNHYVQLARLRQASQRLAWRSEQPITQIALESGYDTSDAFARAFRKRLGQSPSAFRTAPDWHAWNQALAPLDQARRTLMDTPYTFDDVTIHSVAATPIAIMEHRGSPHTLGSTIQRFIAWRKANRLPPERHATFNLFPDTPDETESQDFRLRLCVATQRDLTDPAQGITMGEIPAGRRAVLHVTRQVHDLEPAARFLYGKWLPQSGEEVAEFPLYCQRHGLGAETPGDGETVELFLPLV